MSSQLDAASVELTHSLRASRTRRLWATITELLPGLALCVTGTAIAIGVNRHVPTVSPLMIAIVLGAVLANTVSLPARMRPGVQFSAKKLLRVGIALLGLQLMLGDILALGWGVIAVVVAIVCLGITGTMYAGRLLGLSWSQR
ncbi:MAG TPA: putative sulfate exporter family transporter, partial [Aldersonia sp.]